MNGDVDWDFVPAWTGHTTDDPGRYPIRCNVYQCKELPPSDDNGTSDPYVKIFSPFEPNDKQKDMIQTRAIDDNNNPIFYETIESYFYATDMVYAPPAVLEIYDSDSGTFDSDDFIGRSIIPLKAASVSYDETISRPQWHDIKLGFRKHEPVMGRILVSFNVLDPDAEFKKSLSSINLIPQCDDYDITINVLGLRDLQSPGLLPIRKPFINFMLRSLLPPAKAHAVENIKTQPSATGANPTISTVIKFKISLPNDPLYCPSLTCGVYDYIFKGISQPLIGNFVIDIGKLQHLQDDEFQAEDERTLEIIRSLDSKIQQAEKHRKQLEEERIQAEKERLQEEKLKKQLKEKENLKQRQQLALKVLKFDPSQFNKLPEEENKSDHMLESDDKEYEMGVIRSSNLNKDSVEEKEEDEENSALLISKSNTFGLVKKKQSEKSDKEKVEHVMIKKEEAKQIVKIKRMNMLKKMTKQMKLVGKNVVYPTYIYDDRLKIYREDIPPPKEVFLPIGYDPKHDSKQKHYRRFYEDELENIEEVMPKSPFQSCEIKKGQSRGLSRGWFWSRKTDESGQASTVRFAGEFKGIVSVINRERQDGFEMIKNTRLQILKESLNSLSESVLEQPFEFDYETLNSAEGREMFNAKMQQMGCDNLQITKHFVQMNYTEELTRLMMLRTKCIIRVYILDVDELPPKDVGGSVDPYIKLKLNYKKFNERDNYTPNCHNPNIYKMFEFNSEFPGCGHLKIQMWDYDMVFGDDFIGETIVDLEDRFFSPEWQSIRNKPIEYRQLFHKSTKVPQGVVK